MLDGFQMCDYSRSSHKFLAVDAQKRRWNYVDHIVKVDDPKELQK
jgi:hypothetical protein